MNLDAPTKEEHTDLGHLGVSLGGLGGASRQNTRGAVIDSGGPTSDRHGELIFV